ncbi:MAG: ABC transporter substrate-binding protein [Hydrococcus sp. RU_2_2]|nr:ABC transporter substrate-binding protein [Hydrococcus sp. RU_2_2]
MSSWICDGVPKDGNSYPNASAHEPYENTSPDCVICGLPKEAMQPSTKVPRKTVYVGKPNQKNKQSQWLIPAIVVVALLAAGGGFGLVRLLTSDRSSTPTPSETTTPTSAPVVGGFASENATNGQLLSQGEKILLDPTSEKQAGADAFANKDWDGAIASYQKAADNNPNDPEGRIYLNNAQARKAGNPITIAVAVPITPSLDSAKEVLRGVARSQEEFNQSASGRLLEVVIANDAGALQSASLAQDIIDAPDVLGVLGHGIDPGSQQALRKYQSAGLAVLSPLTISVETSGQSTLKTIPIDQKANELFGSYLQAVSKTLTDYANKNVSPLSVVVFYNSDSAYSEQLKEQLVKAVPQVRGQLIKEVDIMDSGFNADTEIANAEQNGAKVAFLALSKNKVPQAVAIATANAGTASPLALLGGDELYNADILVQGGDAIQGITLAVPWSFQPGDPFAQDAIQSWKGRVSWRTATAYDATKALVQAVSQDPNRAGVTRLLEAGITLTGSTTNFNIFNEVPLVKAVPGSGGPPGSKYEFASIR